MRNDNKWVRATNSGSRLLLGVVFSFALCRANAEDWMPGVPVPDTPHVVTSTRQGEYAPEPGWRFVNDEPGDLTVEPLPAKNAYVPACKCNLTIPAPEGFWTLDEEDPVAKLLELSVAANAKNKTIGMWARTESGQWDDAQCAAISAPQALYGKLVSLSAFASVRKAMREEYDSLAKKALPNIKKISGDVSREATELSGAEIDVSVEDVRFLPPYSDARDRICFTVIRKERSIIDGEESISYSVNSGAMLWMRGAVMTLYVCDCVVENESDTEAATIATREKIAKWIASIEKSNGRYSLDGEDAMVRAQPGCIDEPKKSTGLAWFSIGKKALIWGVIGGLWGLVSSLFKKKKDPSV